MPAVRFVVSLVLATSLAPIAYAQAPTRQPPPPAPGAPARQAPAAPAEAPRPVGSEPEATTATYGDWVMRCQRIAAANATQRVCEVAQSVQAQGQQNPILQIALGSLGAKEPIKLTIVAPVNLSFPSVARLAVDEKDQQPTEVAWRRCLPGGCFADLEVKDDQLKRWRAQAGTGLVKFLDAAGRDVVIPFSFRGLAQALDALSKS